jgi:hypothetical protein
MARFLIATIPLIGHISPILPIVQLLIQRGHEAHWYSGRAFQPKIEATGATFIPMLRTSGNYANRRMPNRLIGEKSVPRSPSQRCKQRIASNTPRALFNVSSYSLSGTESATNPAPACTVTRCRLP